MDEPLKIILYLGAGFCSGFLNTVAGSGSAITLPLLIFLGVPATIANGTNRVQIAIGRAASIVGFQRARLIHWRDAFIFAIPAVLGGCLGALIATWQKSQVIAWAVTGGVIIALVVLLIDPKGFLRKQVHKPVIRWWHMVMFLLVGTWGGFIVLDAGTFAIMVLVLATGYDLGHGNAVKAVALFPMSMASLVIFAWAGEVDWWIGLYLSVGSVIGAWIAARLATREWIKIWIFRLMIAALLVEIYHLVSHYLLGRITWMEQAILGVF
jgi:uncharacterized membrane protein YfcA